MAKGVKHSISKHQKWSIRHVAAARWGFIAASLIMVAQPLAFADYSQKQVWQLQIYHYDVDTTATTTDACSGNGSNTDYKGSQILNSAQLAAVKQNQSIYQQAAQQAGIPWQLLAAIHYRETGLKRYNPGNGDGAYQIVKNTYPPSDTLTDAQFLQESIDAANFIKASTSTLSATASDTTVKQAMFAYNGQAAVYVAQAKNLGFSADQGYEGSPYVMNIADAKRDPTVEPTKSNNTWGQIKTDGGSLSYPADSAYGAFVVYQSLAGTCDSSGTFGPGGVTSMEAAVPLAKQFISAVEKTCGHPSVSVSEQSMSDGILLTTLGHAGGYGCFGGADWGECTTMSGWYVRTFTKYASGHGDGGVWVDGLLGNNPGRGLKLSDTPQAYSIFSYGNHTGVVVGIVNGQAITIEANWPLDGKGDNGQVVVRQYDITKEAGARFVYVGNTQVSQT